MKVENNVDNNYFINNRFISANHTKTDLRVFNTGISFNQPIYHIPVHFLLAIFVSGWRDSASSDLPDLVARRIVCGIALGALSIVGVVDAVIRAVVTIFVFAIQRTEASVKPFFWSIHVGLNRSLYLATKFQMLNFYEKKLVFGILG